MAIFESSERRAMAGRNIAIKIKHRFKVAAALILLVIAFVVTVLYRANLQSEATFEQLTESISREQQLERLLNLLRDAVTGQRGFIITGKKTFLEPYQLAMKEMPVVHAALLNEYADLPNRLGAIQEIFELIDLKLSGIAETINVRRINGFVSAEPMISCERGKQHMDALCAHIGNQVRIESGRRNELRSQMPDTSNWSC